VSRTSRLRPSSKQLADRLLIRFLVQVNFDFWPGLQSAAGIFTMAEVLDGGRSRIH
jgi:hypothetical protein